MGTIEKVIVMMLREDMSRETCLQELVIESLEEALKVLLDPQSQCQGDMKIVPSIHTCLGTEVDLLLRLADILVVHHPQEDIEVIVPIQDQLLRQPMVMTTLIRGK